MTMLWAADVVTPVLVPVALSLKSAFLGGGSLAIGIGVAVWSLKKGWLLFKDLISDDRVRDMTWDYSGRMAEMDAAAAADSSYASEGTWDATDAAEEARSQDAAASSYLDRYR